MRAVFFGFGKANLGKVIDIMSLRVRGIIVFATRLTFLLILGCIATEFAARLYLHFEPKPLEYFSLRASLSGAYVNAPYFNEQFLNEQRQLSKVFDLDANFSYIIARDFHGTYFNVEGGHRFTVGQPEKYSHTLWLFGASTVFNSEVPDDYTIASQLQRLMPTYQIINAGTTTNTIQQQITRLRSERIRAGDDVVFYDGATDVQGIYNAAANQSKKSGINALCEWLKLDTNLQRLFMTQIICRIAESQKPDLSLLDVTGAVNIYKRTILEARHYTETKGATFYYFLEPQLFSRKLSVAENALAANTQFVQPGYRETVTSAWPAFQEATMQIGGFDLTHILDNEHTIYLDTWHTTDLGCKWAAIAMYEAIVTTI